MASIRAAFFDVDETLIRVKSMFAFLDHVLRAQGLDEEERKSVIGRFSRLAKAGAPRNEVNRAYYQGFAGHSHTWLTEQGRAWYAEANAAGDLFHIPVVDELVALREDGARIVLVSGSFAPCLTPVAEAVGATDILSSTPTLDGDIHTGELETPMIGRAKATAARALLAKAGISASEAIAYGDHPSDADFLTVAGRAVAVGEDPAMVVLAKEHQWRHLPLTPAEPITAR